MKQLSLVVLTLILIFYSVFSISADVSLPGVTIDMAEDDLDVANAIKILIGMTALSLAPGLLVILTSFTRIIVVISMLRMALGMQQTPPNTVLISLALFLTLFSMMPVFEKIDVQAIQPYMSEKLTTEQAIDQARQPIQAFMIKQTREEDLLLMLDLAKADVPSSVDAVKLVHLIPAFMLSELKTAFQIGFIIFLPFLLIDIVVASILMSMGMLMVPPMMISLPIKVLMFILIDGWYIVTKSLMESFF